MTLEVDGSVLARRPLADGLPMTRGRGVNVTRRLAELLPAGAKVGEGAFPAPRSDLRPVPHPRARGLTTQLRRHVIWSDRPPARPAEEQQ